MSLWSRIRTLFHVKANAALDRLENPEETLDYAYQQQTLQIQQYQENLVQLQTTKHTLMQQHQRLVDQINAYDQDARDAVRLNRDDLAEAALTRKHQIQTTLEPLSQQLATITESAEQLQHKVQDIRNAQATFRTTKEVIKSQYRAAKAHVHIQEALSGMDHRSLEVQSALDRANDRTQSLQARALAMEELSDHDATHADPSFHESLTAMHQSQAIQNELAALKNALRPPMPPAALEPPARASEYAPTAQDAAVTS